MQVGEKVKLTHAISALSTDCADESTEGVDTTSNAEDREDQVMDDSSMSESD